MSDTNQISEATKEEQIAALKAQIAVLKKDIAKDSPLTAADHASEAIKKEQIAILEKEIESLRAEILERTKRYSDFWKTVIAGIAAIIAFKGGDIFVALVLVAPPLAMLALAAWLNEHASLARTSLVLAAKEGQMNTLLNAPDLIDHETKVNQRDDRSRLWGVPLPITIFLAIVVYGCVTVSNLMNKWSSLDIEPLSLYCVLTALSPIVFGYNALVLYDLRGEGIGPHLKRDLDRILSRRKRA